MIFWLRRRWISRFVATSVLGRGFKVRADRLYDAVALAGNLVIMRKLVKKL
jgi:hypothetical protein